MKARMLFNLLLVTVLVLAVGGVTAQAIPAYPTCTVNGAGGADYTTIQAAVADLGCTTIIVAAGNYAVVGADLNRPMTLLGAQAGVDARSGRPGAQESVITTGGLGVFFLDAVGITIDGFTFSNLKGRTLDTYFNADNFTMRNCILQGSSIDPGYNTGAIQFGGGLNLHANGLLFEQNLVTADNGQLFYMGHAMDNGTIRNNKFNGDTVSFGPFGNRTGWVIEGNEFDGNVAGHGPYWGFGFNANLGDVIIRNNNVHQMSVGIGQISVVGGSITGNTFTDNFYAAFQLWGGEWGSVVSGNVLIENNKISYNGTSCTGFADAAHGIRLRPDGIDASTIHVHQNCFLDLGVGTCGQAWAIRNNGNNAVDAELNWWGTTDGTVIATMFGQGPVDFTPWLTAPAAICAPPPPPAAGPGSVYRAIVGNDALVGTAVVDPAGYPGAADPFYASAKYQQFMFDQIGLSVPVCFSKPGVPQECEVFNAQTAKNQPEICDLAGKGSGSNGTSPPFTHRGLPNVKTPAGNSGWYEWWVRLPIKPSGEINIVIQCGVVKPNAFAVYDFDAVKLCAAETGERIGYGVCVRQEVDPGVSPVINTALPKIKAIAYPGPYNDFVPFNLTAFKNPSSYTLAFDAVTAAMSNNTNSQVLEGSSNTRILLKACMDKAIVTKLPVTGQINALGQTETDLEPGDMIYVRMDVPRQNSVDIYCHAQSARLMGQGEPPF